MSQTLALANESNQLALELYALLRSIDSARFRAELEAAGRQRLNQISQQLEAILSRNNGPVADSRGQRLHEALCTLAGQIEELTPKANQSAARVNAEWRRFRRRLTPTYTSIATTLDRLAVQVPTLRPTNYRRNIFHIGSGLGCLALIQYVFNANQLIVLAMSFAGFCWLMELLRIRYPGITTFFMRLFSPIAHPHEYHRVNSSTWYGTALAVLAVFASPTTASLGVIILAVADPAAALVGRRFGRTAIVAGRTLEGTMAFFVTGTVASLAVLFVYYPALGPGISVPVALGASAVGAVTELVSRRLDDNFTVPVAGAAGAGLVLLALL